MNEYLQPTLEMQYDRIRDSLNRKLMKHSNPQPHTKQTTQLFTTVDSLDDNSERPTSIKAVPRKVLYEEQRQRHKTSHSPIYLTGFQATAASHLPNGAANVELKVPTIEKQLNEKEIRLRMLREELQIMASDTLSQPEVGNRMAPTSSQNCGSDSLRLSQTQKVSSRKGNMHPDK